MSNRFIANVDAAAVSDEALDYSVGITEPTDGSTPQLVLALYHGCRSVTLFLDKADAEQLLGLLAEQMREMGWLS